jgi:hypothetical protein
MSKDETNKAAETEANTVEPGEDEEAAAPRFFTESKTMELQGSSTEELPVRLTPAEFEEHSEALANLHKERDAIEARKKTTYAEFKAELGNNNDAMRRESEIVRTHSIKSDVDVNEYFDWTHNRVIRVRMDTKEIISERAMRADERQGDMFPDEDGDEGAWE